MSDSLEQWADGKRTPFRDPVKEDRARDKVAKWLISDALGVTRKFLDECVDREFASDVSKRVNRIIVDRREQRKAA